MKKECIRIIRQLGETGLATEKYDHLLEELRKLVLIMPTGVENELWNIDCSETAEIKSVSFPESEVKDSMPEEPIPEKGTYSKEEVREILTEASKNGVKIQPLMKQFIPEGQPAKLSSVPAASYAALVGVVDAALAEATNDAE